MLNIKCPINELSYGIVSQNILDNLSIDYRLVPIGKFDNDNYGRFLPKFVNIKEKINLNDPSLVIFHEHSLFDHFGKGKRIGFPIFEKDRFNDLEKFNIIHQDLVIVCSEWAKSVVEPINSNVVCVPLGVDEDFSPVTQNKSPESKVIFYTLGKREVRKGHDYLHKVFHKAFQNNDDVELWMFTHNHFDTAQETKAFQVEYRKLLGNKVKFFPFLKKSELIKWLQRTDCGIFLSRAEGWNMPLLEAMAMGKDVIATYYSGHTQFLPEKDGILPIAFEEAFDNKWFHGGFNWMKIEANEDEIVSRLLAMYQFKKVTRDINIANYNVSKQFTWKNTARGIENEI